MRKVIKTIPFAYILFRFYFIAFNTLVQKVAIFFMIMLYIVYNLPKMVSKENKVNFIRWLIVLGIIFLITFLTPFMHGTSDYSYSRKFISNIFDLICWIAFAIHVKKSSYEEGTILETLTNEFCRIMAMYISFTISCILIPGLRIFWQSIVPFSEKELFELQYAKYIGRIGWDGFAGFNATMMCSLGVIMCVACLNKQLMSRKVSSLKRGKIFCYLITLFVGNMLYGRTGLVTSFIIFVLYLFKESIFYRRIKILLMVVAAFVMVVIAIMVLKNQYTAFASLYNWAFEPLVNYNNTGSFSSTSSTALMEMYSMPSIHSLVTGEGYYTDPISGFYYNSVDVGVLRLVYYWGVIPTIIVYLCTLKAFKNTPICDTTMQYMFLIFLVLFEMKGEAYRMVFVMLCALSLLGTDRVNCQGDKNDYWIKSS